jgi:hypothetical protein
LIDHTLLRRPTGYLHPSIHVPTSPPIYDGNPTISQGAINEINRMHWDPLSNLTCRRLNSRSNKIFCDGWCWKGAKPRLDYFVPQCKTVGAVLGFDLNNVNSIQDSFDNNGLLSRFIPFIVVVFKATPASNQPSKQPSQQQQETKRLCFIDCHKGMHAENSERMTGPTNTGGPNKEGDKRNGGGGGKRTKEIAA